MILEVKNLSYRYYNSRTIFHDVSFGLSKGGGEIPWYVFELPVVVIGCGQPTMLADVPQARTYINTYSSNDVAIEALVGKLMGKSPFRGVNPVDPFCGKWDTHL